MAIRNYLYLTLILFPAAISGQTLPGLVEMLARYPDQEEAYVSLSDSTAVDFQNGVFVYRRYFRSAAMVLRKGGGGVETAATPAVSKSDTIDVSAFTITPESDTIKIPPEEMTLLNLYGNKQRYVLTFPDARAGAVLVLEWKLRSAEPVFSGRRFLGRTYPVLLNRTVISAPAEWVFRFLIQPPSLYTQERSRGYLRGGELWVNYIWEARSLPAIEFEPDSPPQSELISCLHFAFSHDRRWKDIERERISWELIARIYGRHIESVGEPGDLIKSRVEDELKGIDTKYDKLRRLTEFVAANFSAEYSDIDISNAPDQLLSRGHGSQAEAALLLGAALQVADIKHEFFLVSTRNNGSVIKSLPALFYFNRLLVATRIDSDTVWVDPFYKGAPLGVLPLEDQAVEALKVGSHFKDFITTPMSDYRENGHAVHLRITLDREGNLAAEGVELLSGSLNIEEKSILQQLAPPERFDRWARFVTSGIPGAILDSLEFSDVYSDIDPLRISYELFAPNYIRSNDVRLYIPLDILGRWQFNTRYDDRKLPIELGRPHSQQERITIEIPEGFRVEYIPDNFTLTSYLGEILSVVVVTANTIIITRGLSLKPYTLKPTEAGSLNGFLSKAMDQAQKYIVLRR